MSAAFTNAFIENYLDRVSAIPPTYMGVAINWFINRTPLFSRRPKLPVEGVTFKMVGHTYRRRSNTLNTAGITDGTQTSFVFVDASNLMVGDILSSGANSEYIEVTGAPTPANNNPTTVTVNRGVAGTTAAAQANTTVFTLIGNSRTGGEYDQAAVASKPTLTTQYVQTFQHVVSVSGLLNATKNVVLSPGMNKPFDQDKMDSLQNVMDDIEVSSYYGVPEDPASATSGRAKQAGLKTLITTNKVTSPTNSGAFKPSDFSSQVIEPIVNNGGNPDLLLVSINWITGLQRWTLPITRLEMEDSMFGQKIQSYTCPFLGDMEIVPCPFMKAGSAFALSSNELRYRILRELDFQPYGRRGDAVQGDWIASAAVELDNEAHHGYIEGITAFTPES